MAAADLLIVSQLKLKMGAKIPQQSSPRHGSLSAATIYRKLLKKRRTKSGGLNPHLYRCPYSVSW